MITWMIKLLIPLTDSANLRLCSQGLEHHERHLIAYRMIYQGGQIVDLMLSQIVQQGSESQQVSLLEHQVLPGQ